MAALSDIANMLSEGRLGFTIDEVMTGEHRFEPGCGPEGKHFMEFFVTWGTKSLAGFLNPTDQGFLSSELEGTVTVGGLCEKAPCKGSMLLRYVGGRFIRYTFDFEVDGRGYSYVGEKVNIRPWNLLFSHTTCFGTLKETESGKLVSRSVTYFRIHKTPIFLASLRLR